MLTVGQQLCLADHTEDYRYRPDRRVFVYRLFIFATIAINARLLRHSRSSSIRKASHPMSMSDH
jgi:hypothetical protein